MGADLSEEIKGARLEAALREQKRQELINAPIQAANTYFGMKNAMLSLQKTQLEVDILQKRKEAMLFLDKLDDPNGKPGEVEVTNTTIQNSVVGRILKGIGVFAEAQESILENGEAVEKKPGMGGVFRAAAALLGGPVGLPSVAYLPPFNPNSPPIEFPLD